MSSISRKRDSHFDPLVPTADLSNMRPYHEDRVLVKWIPAPERKPEPGDRCALCGMDWTEHEGSEAAAIHGVLTEDCPGFKLRSTSLIVAPTAPSQRDSGLQYGIVIAVGPGNSGITKLVRDERTGQPAVKFKPYRTRCAICKGPLRIAGDGIGRYVEKCKICGDKQDVRIGEFESSDRESITKFRTLTTVLPGDTVLYSRVPPQEFTQGGELFTLLFEEQNILAVIDAN